MLFSVTETLRQDLPDQKRIVRFPQEIEPADFDALWFHGGYPEPFLFLVVRDGKPWFLVEVKQRDESIGGSLRYYQDQIKAPFAFQVVIDADYVDADCFATPRGPLVVPAKTFLSQLF